MENEFNLDFYVALNAANDYLDKLYFKAKEMFDMYSNNPELIANYIETLTQDYNLKFEDNKQILLDLIKEEEYQEYMNNILCITVYEIFLDKVLEDFELDVITYFLESLNEEQFINYMTHTIKVNM